MSTRRTKVSKDKKIESSDEKKTLAYHVSQYPCLWRLTDSNYSNRDANSTAWLEISERMNRDVEACKAGWNSLRDSLRYRTGKKKRKGKSGDSLEDAQVDDDDGQGDNDENLKLWEFYDVMKFMVEDAPKRITISNSIITEDDVQPKDLSSCSGTPDIAQNELNGPELEVASHEPEKNNKDVGQNITPPQPKKRQSFGNYQYIPKKLRKDGDKTADEKIADSIQALVEARKLSQSTSQTPEEKLKYYSMFLNLDRMLQKLPENAIEELNFKFQCLIRDELKKTLDTSE